MKVFIIAPKLTVENYSSIEAFHKELVLQLSEYGVEYCVVNSKNMARSKNNISENSLIIIYNDYKENGCVADEVRELIKTAIERKAEIWPVAADRSTRIPSKIISNKQSYDIWEQLRCRNLDEQYLPTIAKIFSRKIIAKAFPTCYCEEGEVFLSHKRVDGEEITAKIYDKMLIQARESNPFRDVINVKVGDEAQAQIDEEMESSDVFVFIHTTQSADSEWVLKELRFALLRQIPILWIQIDEADIKKLKIKPSDAPHLKYRTEDFYDDEKLTKIVDEILQKSFELIMDRSNQMLGYIDLLNNMFGDRQKTVDENNMIYSVSMERKQYHYPQRNIEQKYQIFGRTPTLADAQELNEKHNDSSIDSVVILTNRIVSYSVRNNVVFDNIQDFCYHWNRYITETQKGSNGMEIIVSGAFPDSDEIFKQSLTDALILFAKTIIRNGYEVTFGAHPTFQELFYEVAKEIEPQNYKKKVNMYISEYFLVSGSEQEAEYREKFNLFISEKREDLGQSLREMRKQMIQRKKVKALVCLGGKIKENKKDEGIREEIELAQEMNIPVFVVGSVGGCSSKVALEYKSQEWSGLNNAPMELNQEFLEGIDYFSMAQEMINYLGSFRKSFAKERGKKAEIPCN